MNALFVCVLVLVCISIVYLIYFLHQIEETINRIHVGVLRGHSLIGQEAVDLHRIEGKTDEIVDKSRYLRLFAEEFTWRLIHFTDEELMELAQGEAWRQERIERDKGNTPQPRTESNG